MNVPKNLNGNDPNEKISFNLIDEPWIPVTDPLGNSSFVGLHDLFKNAESFVDLSLGTLERIAIIRLLLCIAQRAVNGPEEEEDWNDIRNRIVSDSLEYLEEKHNRFDLFGDYPFLQIKGLKKSSKSKKKNNVKEESSNKTDKLDFGLAAGSNTTLFDQFADKNGRIHSYDWLTRYLLVFQTFSPGGTIGTAEWNEKPIEKNGSSNDAPGMEGKMLFALLKGKNLLETIHWNMIAFKRLNDGLRNRIGRPVWEFDLQNLKESDKEELTSSYLGRLVPLSRTILIDPNRRDMVLANGLTYPKLPDYREPMAAVYLAKEKKKIVFNYVRTDPDNHPWRQLHSILTYHASSKEGSPFALEHLSSLFDSDSSSEYCELWTGGIMANKAKIIDTAFWTFSIHKISLEEGFLHLYEKGVSLADKAVNRLIKAIKVYLETLKLYSPIQKKTNELYFAKAKSIFWTALDQQYLVLIKCAESIPKNTDSLSEWNTLLIKEMKATYEKICPHCNARQLQAFALGDRALHFGEKKKVSKRKNSSLIKGVKKSL